MPDSIWAPLAACQAPQLYRSSEIIYLQDTPPTHFYYLAKGTARSFITSEAGGERILTIHRPGDLMGEASFFDGYPRVASAIAISDCQVISIDRNRLNILILNHPELAIPLLQHLAKTVRLVTRHVDDMSFLRADQRIARFLLSLPGEVNTMHLYTHEEIGFSLGLSRVTVSRILSRFAKNGWVETAYRGIRIQDSEALANLSSC